MTVKFSIEALKGIMWVMLCGFLLGACKHKEGCTDLTAINYDETATRDCQCCEYDTTRKRFEGKLTVNFSLRNYILGVNLGDTLTEFNSRNYIPEKLGFYLSNFTLYDEFNRPSKIKDIVFVDFNTVTTGFTVDSISAGNYSAFSFGIGVDSVWNNKTPQDYPAGHVLGTGNSSYYWGGGKNYKFLQFYGQKDLDTNAVMDGHYDYQVGADSLYKEYQYGESITILTNQETQLKLYIDLDKIWAGKIDSVNFGVDSNSYSNFGDPIPEILLFNLSNAITP